MRLRMRITRQTENDMNGEFICITQQWNGYDRIMLIQKDGNGIVEIELTKDDGEKSIAFIYNLWVKEDCRRNGLGGKLLRYAEGLIKRLGYKEATLDCELINSHPFVFDWYKRIGYDGEKAGDGCARMVKQLV